MLPAAKMTTSLMPNSRKNKINRTVLALLGLLICLSACTGKEAEIPDEPDHADYSYVRTLYNKRVEKSGESFQLYHYEKGSFLPVARIDSGLYADLSDESIANYIRLKNEDFYVLFEEVKKSEYWYQWHNHYLKSDEDVTIREGSVLTDEKNNPMLTLLEPLTRTVYVKTEDRRGIEFQGRILYARNEDIEETKTVSRDQPEAADHVPVLMYHFFFEGEDQPKDNNYLSIDVFKEQCAYLEENGIPTLTMTEFLHYFRSEAEVPEGSIVMTIDDADKSVHELAYPVIFEHGLNATLFVICGWQEPAMSWDLWEMRESGIELQSHSFLMHRNGCSTGHGGRLLCVDHDEGVNDTIMSMDYVDGGFVYCYPFGDVNDHAVAILKDAGIKLAFTTEPGKTKRGMDPYRLPRVRVSGGQSMKSWIAGLK